LLEKIGIKSLRRPERELDAIEALQRARSFPGGLADTLMVFLAVPLSEQAPSPDIQTTLSEISDSLRNESFDVLSRYFGSDGTNFSPAVTTLGNGLQQTLAPGCIEIRKDGLWVMFKAANSPAAALPRCVQ